jgi:type IV secretory pathway TrbD component
MAIAISQPREGLMAERQQQKRSTNRVFKSLHKPLTYFGIERTLFYFICVGAVGAFNLFNSILAGIAVFIGGFAFGHWVTNSDPAFLRILARSERYKLRYDVAKQSMEPFRFHLETCRNNAAYRGKLNLRGSIGNRDCKWG